MYKEYDSTLRNCPFDCCGVVLVGTVSSLVLYPTRIIGD